MAANSGFQISLDVRGWPVLVIGGDEEAAEKTQRLLDAGAEVTVITPTLNEALRKLAASAKIIHRGRHFRANDLESVILVLNTKRDDRELSHSLMRLAREQKFLIWSVDQPDVSNVVMPAVAAYRSRVCPTITSSRRAVKRRNPLISASFASAPELQKNARLSPDAWVSASARPICGSV